MIFCITFAIEAFTVAYCVEYDDITGGVLVVQRKQLQKICGGRFYTLSSNKFELFKLKNVVLFPGIEPWP